MGYGQLYFYMEKKVNNNWQFVKNEKYYETGALHFCFVRDIAEVFWNINSTTRLLVDFYKRGIPSDVSCEVKEKIEECIKSSIECDLPWVTGWATIDEFINIDYDRLAGRYTWKYVPKEYAKYFLVGEEEFENDDEGNIETYEPWPVEVPEEYRYSIEDNEKTNYVEVFFQPTFNDILNPYFKDIFKRGKKMCGEYEGRIIYFAGI